MSDSRFVLAIHILSVLADREAKALKSCQVAMSVNTNPVVIRRITGQLAKAGMVRSTAGVAGGSQLARPAAQITLRDVYVAIGQSEIFTLHHSAPNPQCHVGAHIQAVLRPVLASAAACVGDELAKTTLADIVRQVHAARDRACGDPSKPTPAAKKSRGRNRSKS